MIIEFIINGSLLVAICLYTIAFTFSAVEQMESSKSAFRSRKRNEPGLVYILCCLWRVPFHPLYMFHRHKDTSWKNIFLKIGKWLLGIDKKDDTQQSSDDLPATRTQDRAYVQTTTKEVTRVELEISINDTPVIETEHGAATIYMNKEEAAKMVHSHLNKLNTSINDDDIDQQ